MLAVLKRIEKYHFEQKNRKRAEHLTPMLKGHSN